MTRLLAPPEGRQVFELPFTAEPSHIDANDHVNNVVYLAWAQDLAIAHWSAMASAEDQARWAWVVLRHEVDYRRPLRLGETARGLTWVDDAPEGPCFARFCRLDGPEGMCAQVRTVWCLVDPASGRPHRVPPDMVELFA